MNPTSLRIISAIAVLTLVPFAGCIGIAPDMVRWGDEVTLRMEIHAANGTRLAQVDDATVKVGASEFGPMLDNHLPGRRIGDKVEAEVRPGNFSALVVRPALLSTMPTLQTLNRSSFPPTVRVGDVYNQTGLTFTVLAVDQERVQYQVGVGADSREEIPELGLATEFRDEGAAISNYVRSLPQRPSFQGPLGNFLPAGTYRVLGEGDGNIVFLRLDGAPMADALRIEATVVAVERSHEPMVRGEGEYGHRRSPHVFG